MNRIRELRERAGLKRYDIAAAVRRDQSTVLRWEQGFPVPDEAKLALADLFGVTVEHLMRWDTADDIAHAREPAA